MFSILCLSGKRGLKQLQWQKLYTLQRWITNLMQGQNPLVHHHLQLRPRSHQFQLLSTHLQQVTHPGSRQHSRLNVLLLQKLDQQDCQVPQLLHRPQIQLLMPGDDDVIFTTMCTKENSNLSQFFVWFFESDALLLEQQRTFLVIFG